MLTSPLVLGDDEEELVSEMAPNSYPLFAQPAVVPPVQAASDDEDDEEEDSDEEDDDEEGGAPSGLTRTPNRSW